MGGGPGIAYDSNIHGIHVRTYSSTAANGPGSLLPVAHRHPLVQIARRDTTGRPVTPAGSVRRPDSRLPRIRHLGKRNKDAITVPPSP